VNTLWNNPIQVWIKRRAVARQMDEDYGHGGSGKEDAPRVEVPGMVTPSFLRGRLVRTTSNILLGREFFVDRAC